MRDMLDNKSYLLWKVAFFLCIYAQDNTLSYMYMLKMTLKYLGEDKKSV